MITLSSTTYLAPSKVAQKWLQLAEEDGWEREREAKGIQRQPNKLRRSRKGRWRRRERGGELTSPLNASSSEAAVIFSSPSPLPRHLWKKWVIFRNTNLFYCSASLPYFYYSNSPSGKGSTKFLISLSHSRLLLAPFSLSASFHVRVSWNFSLLGLCTLHYSSLASQPASPIEPLYLGKRVKCSRHV